MRPIPHPENEPESSRGEVAERALELLQHRPRCRDLNTAVESAMREVDSLAGDVNSSEILELCKEKLPTEFRFEVTDSREYGIGIKVLEGCPSCGNEKIFNGSISWPMAQFVSYEQDEDGSELCYIDDGDVSVDFLRCGYCREIVHDSTEPEEGDADE